MRKIVILDGYAGNPGDLSWEPMKALAPCDIYDFGTADTVLERCKGAEMVLTNKVPIDADAIAQLPDLKYIGVMATGFNVVDSAEAARRGIIVTNVPAYSTDSVAQLTIAHLLNICWQPQHYTDEAHDLKWTNCGSYAYFNTPLIELAGKQMGIVGLGNIGSAVARMALAMNMRVMAYTSKSPDQLPEGIVKADNLEHLLRTSDVLTMHCPLNADTTGMINAQGLALMKQGSIVLNMARGALIVEQDLADALNSGHLYAAAVDCTAVEPPAADHPLLSARNCYITPHIGWTSLEARTRLMDAITENVAAYLNGFPINVVNKK
ncbi:MAG: D-2-hydroxyacid dehydrogenase [Muribaculaceae bacterium]|nr:D-2-hydroxyacid dehydrogenase [Muribaculaceae bacterium]